MYSDMFTSKRRSVAHRRFLPERNFPYKAVVGCTTACVVLFLVCRIMNVIRYFSPLSSFICTNLAFMSTAGIIQQCGKAAMFLIFLIRLSMVFSGSLYEYSVPVLKRWAVFFVLFSVVCCISMVLAFASYKSKCVPETTPELAVMGVLMVFQDVILSGGFLVSFMRPLKKLLHLVEMTTERRNEAEKAEADKNSGKFYYIAVKITILTAIAVGSTVLSLIIGVVTNFDLFGFDLLINSVCVLFMTPYYQDGRYYQTVCCCCVRCCTPRGKRYLSRVRQNSQGTYTSEPTGDEKFNVSVDTADQVQHAVRNLAADNGKTEMQAVKSAESDVDVTTKTDAEPKIVYDKK